MGTEEGKFFHTVDEDGEVEMQGIVLGRSNGRVTVELFSWITGEPVSEETFTELETERWKFYKTENQWIDAGDKTFVGDY
jgi:hypothetical protein